MPCQETRESNRLPRAHRARVRSAVAVRRHPAGGVAVDVTPPRATKHPTPGFAANDAVLLDLGPRHDLALPAEQVFEDREPPSSGASSAASAARSRPCAASATACAPAREPVVRPGRAMSIRLRLTFWYAATLTATLVLVGAVLLVVWPRRSSASADSRRTPRTSCAPPSRRSSRTRASRPSGHGSRPRTAPSWPASSVRRSGCARSSRAC